MSIDQVTRVVALQFLFMCIGGGPIRYSISIDCPINVIQTVSQTTYEGMKYHHASIKIMVRTEVIVVSN